MKRNALLLLLLLVSGFSFGQIPHKHPAHPKGQSQDQYLALPFYNEACEQYAKGDTNAAVKSLYEAIITSFALTEAHLFLADIYLERNQIDSAFYFYNSGIDFAIEQNPHYYFYLLEIGVELGQYAIMQHNLKNFHKQHKNEGVQAPYEEGYPYNRDDYEFWDATLSFVYNYENWLKKARHHFDLPSESTVISGGDQLYIIKNSEVLAVSKKKSKIKYKAIKGIPEDVKDLYIHGSKALYTRTDQGKTSLYVANGKGRKFRPGKLMGQEINIGNIEAPFMTSDQSRLYFTSDRNGNKDIFVAALDTINGTILRVDELKHVNTSKDETSFFMDENTQIIYFASKGNVGFGGYDIYECTDNEIINGTIFPISPRNMGATFNSHHHDFRLHTFNTDFVLLRKTRKGNVVEVLTPVAQDTFNYDITTPVLPKEAD